MEYIFKNKAADIINDGSPEGWPINWSFPGPPYPPGFEAETISHNYTVATTLSTASLNSDTFLGVEAELSDDNLDTSVLSQQLQITATLKGSPVDCSFSQNSGFNSYQQLAVTEYETGKFGFNQNMYFDLLGAEDNDILIVTVTIMSNNDSDAQSTYITVIHDYSLTITTPGSVQDAALYSVEALILDNGLNTADFINQIIRVRGYQDGNTIQLNSDGGGSFTDYIDFSVSNYSGSQYGIQSAVYFDLTGQVNGETLNVSVEVIGSDPTMLEINNATIDLAVSHDYTMTLGADASIQDGTPVAIEANVLDSLVDTAFIDGYAIRITADILGTPVNINSDGGASWAAYIEYTTALYTGIKHGINPSIYFDLSGANNGDTLNIQAEVMAHADTITANTTSSIVVVVHNYTIANSLPTTVVDGTQYAIEAEVQDNAAVTSLLDAYTIRVSALHNAAVVQLSLDNATYANYLDFSITNYNGSKHGSLEDIYLDLDGISNSEVIAFKSEVIGAGETIEDTDNMTVYVAAEDSTVQELITYSLLTNVGLDHKTSIELDDTDLLEYQIYGTI